MYMSKFLGNEYSRIVLVGEAIVIITLVPGIIILGEFLGILGVVSGLLLGNSAETIYLIIMKRKLRNLTIK